MTGPYEPKPQKSAGYQPLVTGHWSLLVILLAAALLRLYALPTLPPGLNFDEAGNGVAALDILRGEPHLWWSIGGGKEPLWPYLIAVATASLGPTPLTMRLPAALIGILTVAAVYPLIVSLFRREGRGSAWLIAIFTMLGLTFSEWHLHFSRLGFRAILLPLLSTLAFYFLWRSLVVGHWWRVQIVWAGLFTALAVYAYLAGRLLIFVPILFFLLQWLLTKLFARRQNQATSAPTHPLSPVYHLPPTGPWPVITTYYFLLTFFLTPLIFYFLLNPADFVARSGAVSIFNPDWNHGDLLGTAWQTLTLTFGTFLGLSGDSNPLVNLPNQPALPFYLAPFFLLGLANALYHTFHSQPDPSTLPSLQPFDRAQDRPSIPPPSPHLFLLIWWVVMLLPALLAPEGTPHHLRLIGTIVPTYIFVALGFVTTQRIASCVLRNTFSLRNTQDAIRLLPTAFYLILALQTTTNYFTRWPQSTDFTLPFDLYAMRLAADIAAAPPSVSYVLPMDIRAGAETRHYTLDYLLGRGQNNESTEPGIQSELWTPDPVTHHASYRYLPVDERNAETTLAAAAQNKRELRVVRWTQDKHREADAKEIVTYLLETNGQLLQRESFPVYEVETYAVSAGATFSLPAINQPSGVTFDGRLRLDAVTIQPIASPGGWLPVALTLAPVTPMETDYKASLRLIGPGGERLAQKDRLLMHNFHQGTSLWPPETVNEYYLLPVPPDTPSGQYTVVVVLYDSQTQVPLVADALVEVPLGSVWIE